MLVYIVNYNIDLITMKNRSGANYWLQTGLKVISSSSMLFTFF